MNFKIGDIVELLNTPGVVPSWVGVRFKITEIDRQTGYMQGVIVSTISPQQAGDKIGLGFRGGRDLGLVSNKPLRKKFRQYISKNQTIIA